MIKTKHYSYQSWKTMRKRCLQKNSKNYNRYGGRGIKISKEWDDFWVFDRDMGPRPLNFTLDRIDNDGNYEPSNCRWASRLQQGQNTRLKNYCMRGNHEWTKDNTIWTHNGFGKSRRCKTCLEKRIKRYYNKSNVGLRKYD